MSSSNYLLLNYVIGTVTGPKPTAKPPATTELSKLKADVAKLMKEGTKLYLASDLHLYIAYLLDRTR